MKKLFESKKKVTASGAADVQNSQSSLTKNFRQYLQTIILLSKVLQMGIQKAPYQKTYKLQVGLQEFDFKNAKDNLIGSKFLQFITKAINIQFMTATMPNACQE